MHVPSLQWQSESSVKTRESVFALLAAFCFTPRLPAFPLLSKDNNPGTLMHSQFSHFKKNLEIDGEMDSVFGHSLRN
jgi:hypothetical protein